MISQMRVWHLFIAFCVCRAAENDPERITREFLTALHRADKEAVTRCLSERVIAYSAGGSTSPPVNVLGPRFWNNFQGQVSYVRHVFPVTADTAVAVVVWRKSGAAGAMDVILRKEDSGWKVFSWRVADVVAPRTVPVTKVVSADANGWQSLFDGQSTAGWVTVAGSKSLPAGWSLHDGVLSTVAAPMRTSLRTEREFQEFELEWEWRAAEKANSGILYQLFAEDQNGGALAGIEYQIADDDGDAGAKMDDRQKSGAQYGITPVVRRASKPLGEWNAARIVVRGDRCEHWLNGAKTADFLVDGVFSSPISLQQHGPGVDFRNIRIRTLGK